MTADLMASSADFLNQFRMFFSNPADDEKSCFYIIIIEDIENIAGVIIYP